MTNFLVLYDACVLYPVPLRDLLMNLAITDLYRAKWTNEIHDEWINGILSNRSDLDRKFLERTRDKMDMSVRDCLVVGYQYLIPTLILPDADDRHVLAAAIHSSSSVIVTYNLKDFPKDIISQYGIEAQHPDEFLINLIDLSAELVCLAVNRHCASLKNPPKTLEEYFSTLKKQSLSNFIGKLGEFTKLL
ncbi:MAG: PIN domain-containing protein [Gammaproteobacteria bacterium]|nr:PIN domain-containing protein [Gammaproteobacteria bacterium]MCW5584398.1 PIN domain-containing protein [Gammaproteobacteria bacterium]